MDYNTEVDVGPYTSWHHESGQNDIFKEKNIVSVKNFVPKWTGVSYIVGFIKKSNKFNIKVGNSEFVKIGNRKLVKIHNIYLFKLQN